METRADRVRTSVVVCITPYNAFDLFPVALRYWKGTHSAPSEGWKPFPLSSDRTLLFARKNPDPEVKAYGITWTTRTAIFLTRSSGVMAVANTVDNSMVMSVGCLEGTCALDINLAYHTSAPRLYVLPKM